MDLSHALPAGAIELGYLGLVLPARLGVQWLHRRMVFAEERAASWSVAVTLAPTFIFTLVLAGILREQYGLSDTWYGALRSTLS